MSPPRPEDHPEVARILAEAATVSASSSAPVQHHTVPASYLERWAENGVVSVTDLVDGRSFPSPPSKVSRERHFYRLESEDVPPLIVEVVLSRLEGFAKGAIDTLIDAPRTAWAQQHLTSEVFAEFATYLSYQLTRGRAFREEQKAHIAWIQRTRVRGLKTRAEIRRFVETMAGRRISEEELEVQVDFIKGLQEDTWRFAPTQDGAIAEAMQAGEEAFRYIAQRNWTVWKAPRVLLTSDEPILRAPAPGDDRSLRGGLSPAPAIVFPLDPGTLLVMFAPWAPEEVAVPGELDLATAMGVNREMGANAWRYVFGRPTLRHGDRLRLPARRPPIEHEIVARDPDGSELVRMGMPTRWASTSDVPPWPVPEWWWPGA